MSEAVDLSESIVRPVVEAMVRSRGMDEDERAKLVAGALTQAMAGSDYFLMRRESVERLNEAALIAQAIIEMQGEELLRLAADGADVDPDLIGEMVTVQ